MRYSSHFFYASILLTFYDNPFLSVSTFLQLEEKDEVIEAKEEQIRDMRNRLEQTRKMNDALRNLMERDPEEKTVSLISYKLALL
ncbi:unnamed protein product [Protopolystoma xenopodis]|uniref:Uncharacterized protein n=1 Tax=Protopolystoma xenopodis TaxID=117903 RepID=A0A3S5CKX7_9PLAT|nr:unnamed protein product [Protopolystoma xenopodis]